MAAPMNRLWLVAARGSYRIRPRLMAAPPPPCYRQFHPTRRRPSDDPKPPSPSAESSSGTPPSAPSTPLAQSDETAPSTQEAAVNEGNPQDLSKSNAEVDEDEEDFRVLGEAIAQVKAEDARGADAAGVDLTDELLDGEENPPSALGEQPERAAPAADADQTADDDEDVRLPTDEEYRDFVGSLDGEGRAKLRTLETYLARVESEARRDFEHEMEQEGPPPDLPQKRERPGLLAMGDDDELDQGDDEIDEGDDITSMGHKDLEKHREMREYARIIAWDMPLLSKLTKPFRPPTAETPLRFRYTSYLGEQHPAEAKVVVEFHTGELPLEPRQRRKLVQLLGARYDPQRDRARMSCEKFPHPAQNKRYLVDLLHTLLAEARGESEAAGGRDAFDDVPVDFRHVKWRSKLEFPEEWRMTPERRAELRSRWEAETSEDQRRKEEGTLVRGGAAVDPARRRRALPAVTDTERTAESARTPEPVLVR